jgi:PEP-CTERM motif-containing protein
MPMKTTVAALAVAIAGASGVAHASFTTFEGGLAAQTSWQLAAGGSFATEGFESYNVGDRVGALPALGLTFDNLADGLPPGIYQHDAINTPSGPKELSNFTGICCGAQFAFGDVVAHVDAGVNLTAFGFWNGDPQGDAVLRVYDRAGTLIGSVTAALNTAGSVATANSFAGFITDVAVGRLEWEGDVGDGWNHYDDFQAQLSLVPEPETYAMLVAGLGLVGFLARRRKTGTVPVFRG